MTMLVRFSRGFKRERCASCVRHAALSTHVPVADSTPIIIGVGALTAAGATLYWARRKHELLVIPLSDTLQWCDYLKLRRKLRETGGSLSRPALAGRPSNFQFESALEEARAMSTDASRSDLLKQIKEMDIKNMIKEEAHPEEALVAANRISKNQANVDIYLQNAIFFEGLYHVFQTHAAITKVIPYDEKALSSVANRGDCEASPGKITFSENGVGSFEVLESYVSRGLRAVGTNFAHPVRPGGHYEQGSRTQEEALCRRAPNYWQSLASKKASAGFCDETGLDSGFHIDASATKRHAQVKLTTNVHVIRDSDANLLQSADTFHVTIVTIAAPCFHPQALGLDVSSKEAWQQSDVEAKRQAREFLLSDAGQNAVKDAMRSMILSPLVEDPKLEALVLGSWGCGAFKCDWDLIMRYFRDVIVETEALSKYREIHFPLFEKQSCGLGLKFQAIWAEHTAAEKLFEKTA